ncbi:MAG: serine hydrolase [Coriobacteriia bacterium]|nr:serine hydrolase [Coriobacteriia bacterium]
MRNQRLMNCIIAGIACFVVGAVVGILVFSAQQQTTPNQPASPQVQPASNAPVAEGNEETTNRADNSSAPDPAPANIAKYNASLSSSIQSIIEGYDGTVSVAVRDLVGESSASVAGSDQMVAASMIKLLIMAELFDRVNAGDFSLDEYPDGYGGTYGYLCSIMISVSDNYAANNLIDILGMDNINEEAAKLGLTGTQLNRRMLEDTGVENYTTANDVALILTKIHNGEFYSEELSSVAYGYLADQTIETGASDALQDKAVYAHKTGELNSPTYVRNDGGIVMAQKPFVLVILTNYLEEASAKPLMAAVADEVYATLEAN